MLQHPKTVEGDAPWYMLLGGLALGGFVGAKLVGGWLATAGGGLFGLIVGDLVGGSSPEPPGPGEGTTKSPLEEATTKSILHARESAAAPAVGPAGTIDTSADSALERAPVLSPPVKASILAPGAADLRLRPELGVAIPGWGGAAPAPAPVLGPPPLESKPAETPEERKKRLEAEAELEAAYNAMLKGEKASKKDAAPKKEPAKEEGLPTLGKDEGSRDGGSERSSEWSFDAARYNLAGINAYRALHGVAPLTLDARLSLFALAGSKEMFETRTPHSHFKREVMSVLGDASKGFGTSAAENQGDHRGMPLYESDPVANEKAQIDTALRMMHDEGPGGGHYETMVSPLYKRVGIAFVRDDAGRLFMTNDFSS